MQLVYFCFWTSSYYCSIRLLHSHVLMIYVFSYKVLVGEDVPPPSSNTLCMLSVPASIDTHNLLEFTAPYHEVIQQMRIIRDHTPNQFMVLLTFLEEQHASEFYLNLNNLPFRYGIVDWLGCYSTSNLIMTTVLFFLKLFNSWRNMPLSVCCIRGSISSTRKQQSEGRAFTSDRKQHWTSWLHGLPWKNGRVCSGLAYCAMQPFVSCCLSAEVGRSLVGF